MVKCDQIEANYSANLFSFFEIILKLKQKEATKCDLILKTPTWLYIALLSSFADVRRSLSVPFQFCVSQPSRKMVSFPFWTNFQFCQPSGFCAKLKLEREKLGKWNCWFLRNVWEATDMWMLIAAQCAHVQQCVDAAMRTPTLLNLLLLLPSTIGATETSKAEGCNTTSTMPNSISRGAERPDGELTCRDRSEGWQQMNWDWDAKCGIIISVTVIICAILIFAVFLKRRRAERRAERRGSHSIVHKQDSREISLTLMNTMYT